MKAENVSDSLLVKLRLYTPDVVFIHMILARTVPAKIYVKIFRVLSVEYTKPVLKLFLLQKYAKGVISPKHKD